MAGLRRAEGLGTHMVPTRETAKLKYYEYVIQKGYVTDKLWRLEEMYPAPTGKGAAQKYMRGLGAMRLNLTAAAARRGESAQSASMVCGNVLVHFKVQ